jgi:hypothetical protein
MLLVANVPFIPIAAVGLSPSFHAWKHISYEQET